MLTFWGLVLEPSKRYTQKVQQSFHLSQAALELPDCDPDPIQLILEFEGSSYVLGTLSKRANLFQVPLDLNFNVGDQISFRTIGKGKVHLTGYHIAEEDLNDERLAEANLMKDERFQALDRAFMEDAKNFPPKGKRKNSLTGKNENAKRKKLSGKKVLEDSEGESADDEVSEDDTSIGDGDAMVSEEEEEEDTEDFEESEESDASENEEEDSDEEEDTSPKGKNRMSNSSKKSPVKLNGKSPKKMKIESAKQSLKSPKTNASPSAKTPKEKTPKSEKKTPKSEKKDQSKHELSSLKRVAEGGVIIEEVKVGDGPVAKPGKMVQVYYIGRLQSNKKQFDATTQGPGFKFRLGKGEVIRGWDIGVNGMKVGGKRKITIPAQLGYGSKGAPPAIPPNSVLIFEIEVISVN